MTDAREIIALTIEPFVHHADDVTSVVISALTAAGFRIVGPGEVDKETVEKCAEVVEEDNRTLLAKQSGHTPVWLKYARDRATAIRALKEKQG